MKSNLCFWDEWPDDNSSPDIARCWYKDGTGFCDYENFKTFEMRPECCPFYEPVKATTSRTEEEVRQFLDYTDPEPNKEKS